MKEDKTQTKRINAKYIHITLQKIENQTLEHWVSVGSTFKKNTKACLVGIEENNEEGKGVHAHIVIQFSTTQKIDRKQAVKHFGTDSLHISTPSKRVDLLNVLGYASKCGHTKQEGKF